MVFNADRERHFTDSWTNFSRISCVNLIKYEIRMNFLHEKLVMLRMACTVHVWGTIPEEGIFLLQQLRQVLFDIRVRNSNLAKSLSEKSNHAMYQDENPHRCLLCLQN